MVRYFDRQLCDADPGLWSEEEEGYEALYGIGRVGLSLRMPNIVKTELGWRRCKEQD